MLVVIPTAEECIAQVRVELVVQLDNGKLELFEAFRVQHDNSRGPYKGGLRYAPEVGPPALVTLQHITAEYGLSCQADGTCGVDVLVT